MLFTHKMVYNRFIKYKEAFFDMDLIIKLIIWAVCGAVAAFNMKSKSGLLRNIIMGLIGSIVGGFLASLLPIPGTGNTIVSALISIGGACLVIWLGKKLF